MGYSTGFSGPRPFLRPGKYAIANSLGNRPEKRMRMAWLNHIGVAVRDLERVKKLFSILDLDVASSEVVPEQGVKTHFIPLPPTQGFVELLEPMDATDMTFAIASFLSKKGPGIHHLSFQVKVGELEPTSRKLLAEGFRLVYPEPRKGAHNMRVNFVHPATAGGLLVEIMEAGEHADSAELHG